MVVRFVTSVCAFVRFTSSLARQNKLDYQPAADGAAVGASVGPSVGAIVPANVLSAAEGDKDMSACSALGFALFFSPVKQRMRDLCSLHWLTQIV